MTDTSTAAALEEFTLYFVRNYPGPDTVICDPSWHAPKIFAAARRAIEANQQPVSAAEYGPTLAADITALPPRLRRYLSDLEQRADPTWDLRRAAAAEENAMALHARVEELQASIKSFLENPPQISTPLGLLPVTSGGMRTLLQALAENNESLKETAEAAVASALHLTGHQVNSLHSFTDGDPEFGVFIQQLPARTALAGEHMEAGLYAWSEDYPEEGVVMLLPEAPGKQESV